MILFTGALSQAPPSEAAAETGISELARLTRGFDFHGQIQVWDFTFTATFARINADPWPDIAVAGDFGTTQLFLNLGNGTFRSLENPILRRAQFGMGSALGDIDSDGDLDVYHTNGYPESFLTPEDAYETDASRAFVMNEAGTYTNQARSLGLAARTSGRGIVCADFDHDGDTDIFELTDAPDNSGRLWENRSAAAGRSFLRVRLEGLPPNTEAAGARIRVRIGDTEQMREIKIGGNYTSENPTVQIFGLDSATAVDEILVEWPAVDSGEGPVQLGSLVTGPIASGRPGETLVIRHPELPPP